MSDSVDRQSVLNILLYFDASQHLEMIKMLPFAQPCYKTDHGYMWLCPKCGLEVHSDYDRCVRCGWERRTDDEG